MADFQMHDSDPAATAAVTFLDATGAPTQPDSAPVWAEDSNGTVITLVASADGLSATATPVVSGTAVVTVSTTDTDGTSVVGTGTITVTAGEARTMELNWTPGAAVAATP